MRVGLKEAGLGGTSELRCLLRKVQASPILSSEQELRLTVRRAWL